MSPSGHSFLCLFVAASLVARPGFAADPTGASWEALVREADGGNPRMAAARASVKAAESSWRSSRGARLPQVSAGAGVTRSDADSRDSAFAAEDRYDVSLTARQLVYAGGKVSAEIASALAELDRARAELEQVRAEVSFDLKTAAAELQFAQDNVRLARQIEERREENRRLVELRYESGREHKGSLLRSAAAASEARFDAERARRALARARRDLAAVLGRPDGAGLEVASLTNAPPPPEQVDYAALVEDSPLVDQAEARKRIADAAVARARGSLLPDVYLSGSVSREEESFFPERERWSAGVALDFPIFTGGSLRQDLAAARARGAVASENARATTLDVQRDIEAAHIALLDDLGNIVVRDEFSRAAQTRAEIARSQYTSGLLSFEDWDQIENELISAEKTLLAARRDALRSEAAWELAIGKDVFGER